MFGTLPLSALPGRAWLGLLGEWERDPSVDHPSDVGESHLRGRLLGIKCEYVSHRLKMEQTLDI